MELELWCAAMHENWVSGSVGAVGAEWMTAQEQWSLSPVHGVNDCLTKWQWRVVYKPCLTGESPQLLVVSQAGNISLSRAYAPEGLGNVIPSTVQLNYIMHKKSHATSQQPKISDFTLSKTVNDGKLKFSQIVHNRERMHDFSQNIVTQPLTTQK